MNPSESSLIAGLIVNMYPKLDWSPEVLTEFRRRISHQDFRQVQAVVYEVKMASKWGNPQPSDFLGRIDALNQRPQAINARKHQQDSGPGPYIEPQTGDFAGSPPGPMDADDARAWLLAKIKRGEAVSAFGRRWAQSKVMTAEGTARMAGL